MIAGRPKPVFSRRALRWLIGISVVWGLFVGTGFLMTADLSILILGAFILALWWGLAALLARATGRA